MARLLLVDDDESTRLILRRFLSRQTPPLEVHEAANGEEAIRRLDAEPFDLILSDYRMGVVTGVDVLAHALQRRPATLRVLMSGFADPALERAAQERARVHAFIEKPMSTREFEALVSQRVLSLLSAGRPAG